MYPCSVACKEWAAVCAALAAGRQTILLRKGGIDEGPNGFRVAHNRFWLWPTQFHQQPEQLHPADAHWLTAARVWQTHEQRVALPLLAEVHGVHELATEAAAVELAPEQILAVETVRQRFYYRQPGLFVLVLRVFIPPRPHWIDDLPEYAGCKSWVPLAAACETIDLKPALSEEEWQQMIERIPR